MRQCARYLYLPLGGKNRAWLAVPVVFLFVGFWHERTGDSEQQGPHRASVVIDADVLRMFRASGLEMQSMDEINSYKFRKS